jgi:hypothetical protein
MRALQKKLARYRSLPRALHNAKWSRLHLRQLNLPPMQP